MQGMSGSPVYIDGKLLGAVALSFPLSKEAIAGIRPIEDMLRVTPQPAQNYREGRAAPPAVCRRWQRVWKKSPRRYLSPDSRPPRWSISRRSFARWVSIRARGFPAAARSRLVLGDPRKLEPGSMISVQLISGDMTVGAEGTITAIDGDRVYAFGHRFLDEGSTDLPFASAEVLALLPNLSSSFKISDRARMDGLHHFGSRDRRLRTHRPPG